MILPMKTLLEGARKGGYAVGSFNVYNYETIRGVMEAGQETKTPVVVAFGERYLENMSFDDVVAVAKSLERAIPTPFALHLDHCKSIDHIAQAIHAGFTSVMFDGSSSPYEENLARSREVVKMARAANVSVECELGAIARDRSNEEDATQIYTDPEQARDFVRQSGVDALAVSIGTVHGMYKGKPKIDVGTLAKINRLVPIPLVLHGGSGTPDDIIRSCIKNGICKINVNTEISMRVVDQFKDTLRSEPDQHYSRLSLQAVACVREVTRKYIDIFKG